MNKRQKLVQTQFLNDEEKVIKRLKSVYNQSHKDITGKISDLDSSISTLQKVYNSISDDELGDLAAAYFKGKAHITPEEAKETLQSQIQSKVYQKKYQTALQKQVDGILDKMLDKEFKTVSDYITECYENGFVGTMFDLQGQGIPMCFPLDQEAMVRAVQLDSKISKGLYSRLGEDVSLLKKKITAQVSRGISTGMSYQQVAQQLAGYTNIGFNNAVRIARTEGHRVQVQSAMDACYKAKDKGADIVKQWDAALDSRTRESHVAVDGEIRELDEAFSNGLMFPGDPAGGAAEVVNCRCALLQRAKWALDEAELQTLQDRARYFGLDKADTFEEYKKKYLKAADDVEMFSDFVPAKTVKEAEEFAKSLGVKYADYKKLPLETANELNRALTTLPDDVRPVFAGSSNTLEQYWGGKLPRSSKTYYGVTIDTYDGIHLGFDKEQSKYIIDFDTNGQMVGISSTHNTFDKITEAKKAAQLRYQQKNNGEKWFFNEYGESTPFHEIGHVYANAKGIPDGFEMDAMRWARESKCKMLEKTSEAWAEAWGAYYTKNPDLPDYISKYIEEIGKKSVKKSQKGLIFFDDDGIISKKKSEFKKDFLDGKVSTLISPQKQARHIKGSKQFDEYVAMFKAKGEDNLPAYIREDLKTDDLKKLVVNKLKGNVRVNSDGSFDEFLMCDEIVGYYYSPSKGKYIATKCVQVKYSTGKSKNIHIIPVKEKAVILNESET